jgi:hypothetical protein
MQIERAPGYIATHYSFGIHKTIEITGDSDGVCHVKATESNGLLFQWETKKMYLVGHMMYGISVSPTSFQLFAQQEPHPGGMICFDLKTGEEIWRVPTRAEISHMFVGEDTVCCAKSRKSIVLYDMLTGKQIAEHKTPFDNRFTVLTEKAVFCQTHARTWEVIDPRTLRIMEEIKNADIMKDTGSIYKRLLKEYA